jgi:FAD/FMN-containing dehydrogenase
VSFIEDCAVPLEHLAEYVERLTDVFARHGTRGTWYAHASVGTLHVRPILDMRRDGAAKMRAIAEEAAELVRGYKGAYLGRARRRPRAQRMGRMAVRSATHERVREIKDLFDPCA